MRARLNGTGLPPITSTRLSPCAISGTKRCTMIVVVPWWFSVSMMEPRLRPSAPTRKIPMPPMPSSGFRMISWCSAWKRLTSSSSRVTSVGLTYCGNSMIASFSG